jgi:CubicO group peptidase (beta-lactamase class C family)
MTRRALALSLLLFTLGSPLAAADRPASREILKMTREQASLFARLALKGIQKEYPNKPADVLNSEKDVKPPQAVHPAFYGSFDWHSAVHGHWMLVRLLRLYPDLPEAKEVRAALAANLTAKNLQAEADYLARPNTQSFERPYGWAWLLKLAEELHGWDDPDAREWSKNLKPLTDAIVARYVSYFPKQTYPIRSGVHSSTAFGLAFALDHARAAGHKELRRLIEERSRSYFARDAAIPAAWEPDGADFFSPSLMEADLMRRVLPAAEFAAWFRRFLPDLARGEPRSLLEPAKVTDRSDPQIVHLDGLNLSRAWCMRSIAAALPGDDPARTVLAQAAARHADAALGHVASGDYAGEHWLASFAVYLLSTPLPVARVFPGAAWQERPAREMGLDAALLDELARRLGGRGCVIKDGYVVKSWGDQAVRSDWASSAKPVLSTLLFFAIEEGLVKSVDQPIADFGWQLRPKDRGVTFRHLGSMTSGYARPEGPGEAWAYNDYAIQLYQKTLFDRVFKGDPKTAAEHPRRLGGLRLQDGLEFRAANRRLSASVRDFARIAWFWLNRGQWGDRRLLPQRCFDEHMKPQVPRDLPNTRKAETDDYLGIGTYGGGSDHFAVCGPGIYGFNWWFNETGRLHPDARTWPDAPPDTIMSIGARGNSAALMPSLGLVLVCAGGDWDDLKGGDGSTKLNRALGLVARAAGYDPGNGKPSR